MAKIKLFNSNNELHEKIGLNKIQLIKINGMEICLINLNGKLKAIGNQCPHMGYPLDEGNINNFEEIICPFHSYIFNLNTGNEIKNRCNALKIYDIIEIENDGIYVVL